MYPDQRPNTSNYTDTVAQIKNSNYFILLSEKLPFTSYSNRILKLLSQTASKFSILNQNVGPENLDALPLIRHTKLSIIFQTSSTQDVAVVPRTPPPRRNQASFFAAMCI